jgi:hypothetical protein
MAQIRSTDWLRHIWKISAIGAGLTVLGLLLPACHSDFVYLQDTWMWFFGYWFTTSDYFYESSGWPNDFYVDPYGNDLMTAGIGATIFLVIALILMATASATGKQGGRNNLLAGTSIFGGILAIIGPAFYYFYIDSALNITYYGHSTNIHWYFFDQGIGFYLPIIGGIVGIIGGIAAAYAYSLERKGPISTYQPQPMKKPMTVAQVTDQSPREGYKFCPNCGAKVAGPFCYECGTKIY